MRRMLATSLILLTLMFVHPLAYGGDASDTGAESNLGPSETKTWEFNLAPFYGWLVSLDGEATVKTVTVPVEVDFADVFDKLEGLFTVHFEPWYKQKWGGLIDFSYLNIGASEGPLDVDFKEIMTELGVFYRFFEQGPHILEALGGIRYTDLDVDLDILGVPADLNGSQEWLDPIIGARYKWKISRKWMLSLRGDIGGFDIGDASDFTWNLIGLIKFQPWKHVSFFGGYRALYQDYETGSGLNKFKFDMLMHGPALGVDFIF